MWMGFRGGSQWQSQPHRLVCKKVCSVHTAPSNPKQAASLLAGNARNRNVIRTKVEMWSRSMAAGEWILNGESIKVASDGTLLDGQHRLMAIVHSGVTIETFVVRGLPPVAQETVDIGDRRSVSDILTLRGEVNTLALAAALMVAWRITTNGHLFGGAGIKWPSAQELLDYLDSHPGMRESVRIGESVRKQGVLRYPGALVSGLHYLMSELDVDDANVFWERLSNGESLNVGDPIHTLRQLLLRDQGAQRRMATTHRAAVTIKAWNAYRAGRSLQVLKWSRGGSTPEAFPTLA